MFGKKSTPPESATQSVGDVQAPNNDKSNPGHCVLPSGAEVTINASKPIEGGDMDQLSQELTAYWNNTIKSIHPQPDNVGPSFTRSHGDSPIVPSGQQLANDLAGNREQGQQSADEMGGAKPKGPNTGIAPDGSNQF